MLPLIFDRNDRLRLPGVPEPLGVLDGMNVEDAAALLKQIAGEFMAPTKNIPFTKVISLGD